MDRSYPYSRRLVSRARLRKRMAAVAAAGLLAATAVFMLTWKPDPISAAVPSPGLPLSSLDGVSGVGEPTQRAVRRIYPYSVVPGGVSGQGELQRIIRTDSVVAAHYATFDADKARAVVVDKPRAVHVSYRKGDKVYWTVHKVMLAPGETLLSDGSNEMRARCANRISDIPQYPVEAHQPAMAELDQPVELSEGEEYLLGPDGMPVAMAGDGGTGRNNGMRFPARGGAGSAGSTGSGTAGTSTDGTRGGSLSSSASGVGPAATMGLSGSASSMGSRPRPTSRPAATPAADPITPAKSEVVVDPGPGASSGSSDSPTGGGTAPGGQADSDTSEPVPPRPPATTAPRPTEATPPSSNPAAVPRPATVPVADRPPALSPQPASPTRPLPSQPAPATDPVSPEPIPDKVPPQTVEQPAPTEVPEPGSLWLFGLALAAMCTTGIVRRPRRA